MNMERTTPADTEMARIRADIATIVAASGPGLSHGFAHIGRTPLSRFPDLPQAVSILVQLDKDVAHAVAHGPNAVYYDEYKGKNALLDSVAGQVAARIRHAGRKALAVEASKRTDPVNIKGDFPHKLAAVKAGLGWIGKSSLFLTRTHGPWLRLATVLTDLPLAREAPIWKNQCGTCRKCQEACPAGAIQGNAWFPGLPREELVDVRRCDAWKIEHYAEFKGQVCGICMAVCPYGQKSRRRALLPCCPPQMRAHENEE
jgi:epoxyqueuosine reductase QueG